MHMHIRLLTLLATLALLATACGGDDSGGEAAASDGEAAPAGDAVADQVDLDGVALTVGSKEFTEQILLGQVALQALEAAGADVTDQTGLVGTPVVREALESGEVDMYWEYTGTGWINILGNDSPVPGVQEQYEAVRDADLENGLTWLDPAEASNTYALAAGPTAEDLGVESISDFAALAEEQPDRATLCSANEFITRDDGLPGLEETYGFEAPSVSEFDFGLVYTSVAEGDPCEFAVVFATDGEILGFELNILEDDQAFFPAYNVAPVMDTETYEEAPEAFDELFGAITEVLDDETLQQLNAGVVVDGLPAEDVARDFLVENGIISG